MILVHHIIQVIQVIGHPLVIEIVLSEPSKLPAKHLRRKTEFIIHRQLSSISSNLSFGIEVLAVEMSILALKQICMELDLTDDAK